MTKYVCLYLHEACVHAKVCSRVFSILCYTVGQLAFGKAWVLVLSERIGYCSVYQLCIAGRKLHWLQYAVV